MPHGLPICSRSSQLNYSQRCFYKSNSELRRGTSPRLSIPISLAPSQGSRSPPSILGHPKLRPRSHPPPPPHPQNSRDFSPVQSLACSRSPAFNCHVHETIQVSKACGSEPKIPRVDQLSTHCRRHHSLPLHLTHFSKQFNLLHARRSDVLFSSSDRRSLHPVSRTRDSVLQSHSASRVSFHRSLSLPRDLHLQDLRSNSPLHPGESPLRLVQSAPPSPILAEDFLHPLSFPRFVSDQAGILGPSPLHIDPARPTTKALSLCTPPRPAKSTSPCNNSQLPKPTAASDKPAVLRTAAASTQPGLLPNSRLRRTATSHLSAPTPPSPAGANKRLQRSLHLHSCSPHSSHFRPSRICANPKQQTRVRLGHSKCVGQSADLRSAQRPPPPPSMLPLLLLPRGKVKAPLRPTLASLSFGSHPIPYHVTSSPPLVQFQHPFPPPSATFSVSPLGVLTTAFALNPTQSAESRGPKSPTPTLGHKTASLSRLPLSPPHSPHPAQDRASALATDVSNSETKNCPSPTVPPPFLPNHLHPLLPGTDSPTTPRQLSPSPSPLSLRTFLDSAVISGDSSPVLPSSPSPSSHSSSSFQSCTSPPRFPCYPPPPSAIDLLFSSTPGTDPFPPPDTPPPHKRTIALERLRLRQLRYPFHSCDDVC
uniref:Movement protein n=1 Tax=Eggplant mosaic virus TaxID=12151 RepID=A0A068LG36_EPMV|nr:movement protein [Eggplant mosaic virus]WIW79811.1 movement protein [Eggplant mosaic virus]